MKKRTIIMTIICILNLSLSQAQNPPSLNWLKIQTPHFEIVFPEEISSEAQRTANTLEHIYPANVKSLKVNPKPVSVLLFNQTTISNAYAGLGPRRMGWNTTPFQFNDLGSTDWLSNLSLHEYRHVVQMTKNNEHITKLLGFFYGDNGQMFGRWSIPSWFFEGDAVYTETV